MKVIIEKNVSRCKDCPNIGYSNDMGAQIIYCKEGGGHIDDENIIYPLCPVKLGQGKSKDSYDSFEEFQSLMKAAHEKLGVKKGKHMLEEAELGETWERFAKSVQNALAGANPTQIKQRLVQVANNVMYVHEMLEREDSKTGARKIAEARNQRMKEKMSFEARSVDSID